MFNWVKNQVKNLEESWVHNFVVKGVPSDG